MTKACHMANVEESPPPSPPTSVEKPADGPQDGQISSHNNLSVGAKKTQVEQDVVQAVMLQHDSQVLKTHSYFFTAKALGLAREVLFKSGKNTGAVVFIEFVYADLPTSSILRRHLTGIPRTEALLLVRLDEAIRRAAADSPNLVYKQLTAFKTLSSPFHCAGLLMQQKRRAQ